MKQSNNSTISSRGFTLLELLIVFGIMAVLSGSALFFGRNSETQLILYRDQSKIIGALQKAKSLSLNSYGETNQASCGYGVNFFSPNNLIIFKKLPAGSGCSNTDFTYSGNPAGDCKAYPECMEKIILDPNVKYSSLGLNNVLFIPPDPIVRIDNDPLKSEAAIAIKYGNFKFEKTVKINNGGQITAQ